MDKQNFRITQFRSVVYEHFDANGRSFPWRETQDPYKILVSEVMLQQTQTHRVLPKYLAFIDAFPTAWSLADATLHDVLACWQGLGYNRRGLMLKRAAEELVARHAGIFPREVAELQKLPGIGPYTAAAVVTFAFNEPLVFIETNIRSVFIHTFFNHQQTVHDRELMPLIEKTLDRGNPRLWYYALMDFGVMLKKKFPNPNRKSRHYAKQSRFEGSDRQIRGAVIRLLTKHHDGMVLDVLLASIKKDPVRVDGIIAQLEAEGMLRRNGDLLLIA